MPWCDSCDKYLAPNAVNEDGSCPDCATKVDASDMAESDKLGDTEKVSAPWHFWLMVIALTVYLGWRLIQFVIWLLQKV